MNATDDKEIASLQTAVVVRASDMEEGKEGLVAEARFDATTKRGTLKLLRKALAEEKHEKAAA